MWASRPRLSIVNFVLGAALASALADPAFAQLVPARNPAAQIAVRPAGPQPAVGEEVFNEDGVLDEAQFTENTICGRRACRTLVFDNRSGALIFKDGVWSPAYAPTERGRQVVRVTPFSFAEYPPPAADDKALERAPAIRKVTRGKSD